MNAARLRDLFELPRRDIALAVAIFLVFIAIPATPATWLRADVVAGALYFLWLLGQPVTLAWFGYRVHKVTPAALLGVFLPACTCLYSWLTMSLGGRPLLELDQTRFVGGAVFAVISLPCMGIGGAVFHRDKGATALWWVAGVFWGLVSFSVAFLGG